LLVELETNGSGNCEEEPGQSSLPNSGGFQKRTLFLPLFSAENYRYVTALIFPGLWIQSGSGSGLDPDSVALWIWIRNGIPYPDQGARKLRKLSGKMNFSVILKKFKQLKVIK
jgi:hypothetical protein